jgi:hypothetical protein
VIANKTRHFALADIISAIPAAGQTPDVQELQNKLVQLEQSTQKTIQELTAQTAVLEQAKVFAGAVVRGGSYAFRHPGCPR